MPEASKEARKAHNASKIKEEKHYLRETWRNMKRRCQSPNHYAYPQYGGRGIKVATEWEDFENFFRWAISNGYIHGLTLDREDVNGDYSPQNCRWASWKAQGNNRRTNRLLAYNGETKTIAEWADTLGMSRHALWRRLNGGWSVEEAITIPLGTINRWNRKENFYGSNVPVRPTR